MDPSTFSPEISEYRSPYNDDEGDTPQTTAPPSPPPATISNGSPTESPSESFSKRLFGAFKIKTKPSARSPVAETQLIAPAEQLLTAAPAAIEVSDPRPTFIRVLTLSYLLESNCRVHFHV